MNLKPKRTAVIGLDCALPHLIEKHIAEGHLPNFNKLISTGVIADNCLANYPTVTPPNWATIATGAWAGTHGITDFHVHEPGTPLDNTHVVEAFSSRRFQAETLWDAADKAGKRCIVVNYPGAWPSHMQNGIMVGGQGLTIGENRDGHRGLESDVILSSMELITTGRYPLSTRSELAPASGWKNVPEMGDEPLQIEYELMFRRAREKPAQTVWHVLIRNLGGAGYDTATLSPSRDFNDAFCTLTPGQWSPRVTAAVAMPDGSKREVFFRCKLIELSEDAEEFRLLITDLCQVDGWSDPPEIARTLTSAEGVIVQGGGLGGYAIGWFGLETYVELNRLHDLWLGDAVCTLLKNHAWDLFYMHSHPPDWLYHAVLSDMDPATCRDDARRRAAWDCHLRVYQSQDQMIGRILECCGDDCLVVLVSDHGAVADGPSFNPYHALVPAGLSAVLETADLGQAAGYAAKVQAAVGMTSRPDPKRSKAIAQRAVYVYVNLKGRDPDGIVAPEDYPAVQQQIIDALYAYRDPKSGRRAVSLALSRQDARLLGLCGERVGDVVYALYPEFGSQHGQVLPTAEWGVGSLKGLLVLNGPGIKKGHRLQRTVWLTDLVPTLCCLADLPLPEQAEGAVMVQAFEEPDSRRLEIEALKGKLEAIERRLTEKPIGCLC
jgi:predicted AlkP superfamily phosphohydrolase/phosphomutase